MAKRLTAIAAYRPRIELGNTTQKAELSLFLSNRTGLSEGSVELVLKELGEAIIYFCRGGRPTRIESLGTFIPDISPDGVINVLFNTDKDLKIGLNDQNLFSGTIHNRGNIGKTTNDLVMMWNEAHPEDTVR